MNDLRDEHDLRVQIARVIRQVRTKWLDDEIGRSLLSCLLRSRPACDASERREHDRALVTAWLRGVSGNGVSSLELERIPDLYELSSLDMLLRIDVKRDTMALDEALYRRAFVVVVRFHGDLSSCVRPSATSPMTATYRGHLRGLEQDCERTDIGPRLWLKRRTQDGVSYRMTHRSRLHFRMMRRCDTRRFLTLTGNTISRSGIHRRARTHDGAHSRRRAC